MVKPNDEIKKYYKVELSDNAKETPKRIAFIKNRTSVKVKTEEEEMVMTIPHLVIKEVIAFIILIIFLVLVSILFDAPLEWIANPDNTPNPSKAPWYFLGLQELLHYFPPVVGGVLIPALAIMGLIVLPYFNVNLKQEGLWEKRSRRKYLLLMMFVIIILSLLVSYNVVAMIVSTILMAIFMFLPYHLKTNASLIAWFRSRSLTWWIMTWFVVNVIILTVIGTYFRGPEWKWTFPWEGIY